MRDDKRRARFDEPIDRFLHMIFRHVVERGCRFVHNEEARVTDEGARDADSLLLSARKLVAVFAHLRVDAVGERGQEFGDVRILHRFLEFLFAVRIQAVSDVFPNGARKENAVLRHDGNKMAIGLTGHLVERNAVDEDHPLGRLQKPDEKIDNRTLARPGRADHGDTFAHFHMDRKILDDVLFAVGIAIGNVLEIHPAFDGGEHSAPARAFHILGAHDLRKGADRLLARHQSGIGVDERQHGAVYRAEQGLKEHHRPGRNDVLDGEEYAKEQAKTAQKIADDPRERAEIGIGFVQFQSRLRHRIDALLHFHRFHRFQTVRFGERQHLQHRRQFGRHLFVFHAEGGIRRTHFFTKDHRIGDIERNDGDEKQSHPAALIEGNPHRNHRADDIGYDHLNDVSVVHIHAVDIAQELRLNFAALHLLVISDG